MNIGFLHAQGRGLMRWFGWNFVMGQSISQSKAKKYGFQFWARPSQSGQHVKVQFELYWGNRSKIWTNYKTPDRRTKLEVDTGHRLQVRHLRHYSAPWPMALSGKSSVLDFADEVVEVKRVWIVAEYPKDVTDKSLCIPMYNASGDLTNLANYFRRDKTKRPVTAPELPYWNAQIF